MRLYTDIPNIRPALLSETSFLVLDKIRAFRHFIRHAYDCELIEEELRDIQNRIKKYYVNIENDFLAFKEFIRELSLE